MATIITTNLPPTTATTTATTTAKAIMVVTIKAFRLALEISKPGQKIIYYTGDLMYDREYNTKLKATDKRELNSLAKAVYDAYEVGRVLLTQKRVGPHVWEYQATMCRGL